MAESSTITREMIEAFSEEYTVKQHHCDRSRTNVMQNAKNSAADNARKLMYPALYTPTGIKLYLYATTPNARAAADSTSRIDLDIFMGLISELGRGRISRIRNARATIRSRLPTGIPAYGLRGAALATEGARG